MDLTNNRANDASADEAEKLDFALLTRRISRRDFLASLVALGFSSAAARLRAADIDAKAATQIYNSRHLRTGYDYIVCGGGTAGCVIARRLADNPASDVLLLEAGGSDDHPAVIDPARWPELLGGALDWQFRALAQPAVNGRALPLPMGRVLGGGSSINALVYARGHQADYDAWSACLGDPDWSYAHVLSMFRRIEAWHGPDDPHYRGKTGILTSEPIADPLPVAVACLEAGRSLGIPAHADQNAAMMEGPGGICHPNTKTLGGRRRNTPTDYLYPILDRPNLTVLTGATVQRLRLNGSGVDGVEFVWRGEPRFAAAAQETVLSLGAIQTPKVLLLSGVGPADELARLGITPRHDLPGVGRDLHDHPLVAGCVWEDRHPTAPRGSQTNFYWTSDASLKAPDLVPVQLQFPFASEVTATQFDMPASGWTIVPALATVASRGRVSLQTSRPDDPPLIEANFLREPEDLSRLVHAVELCRELGNAAELRDFAKREVMPGPLSGKSLEKFVRDAVSTYFHLSGSCRMGLDELAVVDGSLRVRGVDRLRIADTSVMPTITRTNTMVPAILIAERLAEILAAA